MGGGAVLVTEWLAEESIPRMEEVEEAPTDQVEMQSTMAVVAVGGATLGEVGDHPIAVEVEDLAT